MEECAKTVCRPFKERAVSYSRWLSVLVVSVLMVSSTLSAAEKPNLVVFICDDLGTLDITPYG